MTGIQGLLVGMLEDVPSPPHVYCGLGTEHDSYQRVVQDELFDAFSEKFTEDRKPRRELTLAEHDEIEHPNGFDPETETCKFRERMEEKDSVDLIYATSDIHQSGLEDITDTDCGTIVLAGDFMEKAKHHADFKQAGKWWDEHFIPWCESHKDQQIVIIGGNCDKWLYENRDKVEWPKNVHYLDDSLSEVNGMKVYGTSWCPHNMNGAWEVDDDRLEEEFSKIPEGLDILVTHVPPKGDGLSIDRDDKNGGNFGSEALTRAILEKKPKIVLCGHIHRGDHKPVKIGDSIVMNVSRVDDDRYEQAFHGRRIGVERSDTGLGFLVDMNDMGRVEQPKREEIPDEIIRLRDALRTAAKTINHHVEYRDYQPNPKKVEAARKAIEEAEEDLAMLESRDKKKMLESVIASFRASEESGFKKPVKRVGKLFDGDDNGTGRSFAYSWEDGGSPTHGAHFSFSDLMAGIPQDSGTHYGSVPYSQSHHVDNHGKYKSPWKSGASPTDIVAAFEEMMKKKHPEYYST